MTYARNDLREATYAISRELNLPPRNLCGIGSVRICGEGRDLDILCLCDPWSETFVARGVGGELQRHGFQKDVDSVRHFSPLASWRRKEINLIVVEDAAVFASEASIAIAAEFAHDQGCDLSGRGARVEFHANVRARVKSHVVGIRS